MRTKTPLGHEFPSRHVECERRAGSNRSVMKATTLLERQHRNLQQLCEAVERGSATVRQSLLPQLAGDVAAHIAVEELVFYPAACEALHQDTWLRSAEARHAQARRWLHCALEAPVE